MKFHLRYALAGVGRAKRHQWSQKVSNLLAEELERNSDERIEVAVTDTQALRAFSQRPFGRPPEELIETFKLRIRSSLQQQPVTLRVEYRITEGVVERLEVIATRMDPVL